MKLKETLRKINRTVLEMHLGILAAAVICEIIGCIFAKDAWFYSKSLLLGAALAFVNVIHIYKTLERGLEYDQKTAAKIIFTGYMVRYIVLIVFVVVICMTKTMDPLIFVLGYMGLKVAAYLQPFTHKLTNAFFGETDPIPEPMPEEMDELREDALEKNENEEREVKI